MRTVRTERMIGQVPDYYQNSQVFEDLLAAAAGELDTVAANDADLRLQFSATTATWGLEYWEKELGIPIIPADSYEIRRSRVVAKERGPGNYNADLIKSVCEAFSGGEVAVTVNVTAYTITVTFIGARGIPENLEDLKNQVAQVIHAHIEPLYAFTYLRWEELDATPKTWDEIDALVMTWDEFEVWQP